MGKYVDNNLGKDEKVIQRVKFFPLIIGGLINTITSELAFTNKKVVGKTGLIKTQTLDAPLNKVQNASFSSGFWGKIHGYGTVTIDTAGGSYAFKYVKNAQAFKTGLLNQIDQYEQDKIDAQAKAMAASMANANK